MSKYRSSRVTRKIYETSIGPIPRDEDGRSFEIHHIDGNWRNDDPSNLIALSIQGHYDIHYAQGDFRACTLIGRKMNISPEQISLLASLSAKQQVRRGIHNFLGGKIQSTTNKRRIADGTHPFLDIEKQRKRNRDLIENGTHHFVTNHPNKVIVICPHCSKSGGAVIMKRWHFDNCRSKESPFKGLSLSD